MLVLSYGHLQSGPGYMSTTDFLASEFLSKVRDVVCYRRKDADPDRQVGDFLINMKPSS